MTAFKASLLILLSCTAAAFGSETGTHSKLSQAIRDSFQYNPVAQANAQQQPTSEPVFEIKSDPEIIVLPKYDVRSGPLPRGLTEAIAKARPLGPQNHSKLGTGIHQKDFGKVRFSAVTVLYVPIFVGLSW